MPGNRYAQVLNTYLTRRLLLAAMLGALAISLIPIVSWWIVGTPRTADRSLSMFGFILAFPAMFIGAHVKQQLATHEASLVPGYRIPHIVVAASLFLVPLLIACLTASLAGGSIAGYAALLLLACLTFFHLMAAPSGWNGLAVAMLYSVGLIPQLRIASEQILAGKQPGLAWCLLSAEAAIGVLLFHRLANLTEDDPSWGNVIPMNAWDMRAAEVRRRNRAQLQKLPKVMLSLIDAESKRLDRLTVEPATTRRQRVALLQFADDWPVNLTSMLLMVLLMEGLPLLLPNVANDLPGITNESQFVKALSWPIMLSLMIAWVQWLPQSQRLSRLGYESLRPSTRPDWVLENGLAIIRNTLRMQAGWLVVQIVLLFTFLPAFASSPAIVNGLVFLVGVHVLLFGAAAGIASFGSMFWKIAGFLVVMGTVQAAWPALNSFSRTYSWPIPVFTIISVAAGIGLTRIAYRRWCRIDLM